MNRNFLILIIIFSLTISTYSQTIEKPDLFKWFDGKIGVENTDLFNGVEYVEQHRVINEKHKFYNSPRFQESVIEYYGQKFFEVPLKYNIFEDVVIVRIDHSRGSSTFQLINDEIDSFRILETKFVNVKPGVHPQIGGFYEVIHEGNLFLTLKKHKKKIEELLDKKTLYHEFENLEPDYVIRYNNSFSPIEGQKDLIKLFPQWEKEIKSFYKSNKRSHNNDRDNFMKALSREINKQNSFPVNNYQE